MYFIIVTWICLVFFCHIVLCFFCVNNEWVLVDELIVMYDWQSTLYVTVWTNNKRNFGYFQMTQMPCLSLFVKIVIWNKMKTETVFQPLHKFLYYPLQHLSFGIKKIKNIPKKMTRHSIVRRPKGRCSNEFVSFSKS